MALPDLAPVLDMELIKKRQLAGDSVCLNDPRRWHSRPVPEHDARLLRPFPSGVPSLAVPEVPLLNARAETRLPGAVRYSAVLLFLLMLLLLLKGSIVALLPLQPVR